MRKAMVALYQRAGAVSMDAPWTHRLATRTGGPDDDGGDEDEQLRRLMPILAAVIAIAVVFGG